MSFKSLGERGGAGRNRKKEIYCLDEEEWVCLIIWLLNKFSSAL